jgi:RHS repeat-associated protein
VIKEDAMKFKASCILFAIYLLSVIFLFNGPVYASMGSETSRNVADSKMGAVNNAVINEKIEEPQQASRHDAADSAVPDYADAETEGIIYPDDAGAASPEKGSDKDKPDKKPKSKEPEPMTQSADPPPPEDEVVVSAWSLKPVQISPAGNSGAAMTSIPIKVPPGIKGIQPNIALTYNSSAKNGWIGVGWNLDMGSIQRNTKRGVVYSDSDFIVSVNGSASELAPRGENYYGAKIEGAFSRYYYNSGTGGWEVTTKDGTKYYYGTSLESRQNNPYNTSQVFKWCLDKVEDTNGNYMEIFYEKNQGEIYLDRIDYTGPDPNSYVKFYREGRTDAPPMYTTNFEVRTAKRLKTIEVNNGQYPNGTLVRKYELEYDADLITPGLQYSYSTGRSVLGKVTQYGSNGTALPTMTLEYQQASESGTFNGLNWSASGVGAGWQRQLGDFDGDGTTDIYLFNFSSGENAVWLNNGDGTFNGLNWSASGVGSGWQRQLGDFDGDGTTDIYLFNFSSGENAVWLNNGDGSFNGLNWSASGFGAGWQRQLGDFDGDGTTDIYLFNFSSGENAVWLNNGDGSFPNYWYWSASGFGSGWQRQLGDFNGDGVTDIYLFNFQSGENAVWLNNGDGSFPSYWYWSASGVGSGWQRQLSDFNGDGTTDIYLFNFSSGENAVWLNNGDGSFNGLNWSASGVGSGWQRQLGDFNGNGITDIYLFNFSSGENAVWLNQGQFPDLLSTVNNSIGATATLEYKPSSAYSNIKLPFIVQTLSSVTVNDGNGISSTTHYDYQGGNFDAADREYRGVEYVWVIAPDDTYTKSKYYVNDNEDILKGRIREQTTRDSSDNIYAKSVNYYSYTSPYAGINFPYLYQKDDFVYDSTTEFKKASATFEYDGYGNITRKHFEGDVSITGDERDEYTYYAPYDTANWIVALPKGVYVTDSDGYTVAQEWFAYDSKGNILTRESWLDDGPNPVTSYAYDSYGNINTVTDPGGYQSTITTEYLTDYIQVVAENNLGHTIIKKIDYGHGKVIEETDPNGYTTMYEYDEFGRVAKIIGPKDTAAIPSMKFEYLNLGTLGGAVPENDQKVKTCALKDHGEDDYLCKETYFDGLGRTFRAESDGPDNKVIVTETIYNDRGLVSQRSFPYFKDGGIKKYTTFQYDPIGRNTITTYTDGTVSESIYYLGTLTAKDPNGHQRVEIKDIYGRVIEVREYTGTYPDAVLYATTIYGYDPLGNLEYVRDALGDETYIVYDTLSRKTAMYDPDMGLWEYEYDANGNLVLQTDNADTALIFQYDELNRIKAKIYPDNTSIDYQYDQYDDGSPDNATGRLTKLTDLAGLTIYHYDELENTIQSDKIIDEVTYTTKTTYDALGRTENVTYPDDPVNPTIIKYTYDAGGNLLDVENITDGTILAAYSNYNALGQVGRIDYSNGITTQYSYYDAVNGTNRIKTLITYVTDDPATQYMTLEYYFDAVGNITQITDHLESSRTRTYEYDELSRLVQASTSPAGAYGGNLIYQYDKVGNMTYNCRYGDYYYDDVNHVHAVTRIEKGDGTLIDSYAYDLNGNMTAGAGRTFTYDYDNRPTSIVFNDNAVISVYDAGGQRVKKTATVGFVNKITTYIGDIYECTDGQCTKYVFGGSERVAKLDGNGAHFYHTDHLGSSTVITKDNAVNEQDIFYYPYGEIHTNSGTDVARHKFTGQEWDAETGLYYYGARYYDPKLARFISADTIVPGFANPQSLNRYSYTINNPIIYTDPEGNYFLVAVGIGMLIGGVSAEANGGDFWEGAWIGAASAAVGYGAGVLAGTVVSSVVGCAASCTSTAYYASTVAGGAAGGAAAGGTSAFLYGGDVGQGALIGAFAGGIGGYLGTINYGSNPYLEGMVQISSGGAVGGIASELSGGQFWDGFASGAMSGAVAFGANRLFEAKRYQTSDEQQKEKVLKLAKEKNVDIAELIENPTVPQRLGDRSVFVTIMKEIYQPFGSEIDYIRKAGAGCGDCLRFGNFHVKSYGNQTYIHYDRVNATYSLIPHVIRDWLLNW